MDEWMDGLLTVLIEHTAVHLIDLAVKVFEDDGGTLVFGL